MSVILHQTSKNTLTIFLGFAIGGLNVLFMYTHFLQDDYYGLVTFLLSTANILMPLLVFGMQHTIVKFFSSYSDKTEKDRFLLTAVMLPALIIIPLAVLSTIFYDWIAEVLSKENIIIKKYTYLIYFLAVFMGYFEVFYAWSKVQMQSVFGNFIREIFARISITFLLTAVFMGWLTDEQFIYAVVWVYLIRMLIMMVYAVKLYKPEIKNFSVPKNFKKILTFSFYIILAGSAGTILLEIDKFMIPQMEQIAKVAYYAVGVYIASVIAIPSRAMQQIVSPITAREMNRGDMNQVGSLYRKSSINLLIAGGLLFLLINLNVVDLYRLIDKPEYTAGISVVLIISLSELAKLSMGSNSAILTNSKYYRVFFYFSVSMALSVILLNRVLIEAMGINGAALATLLVVLLFNAIKIWYVKKKLKMQPYSGKTLLLIMMILVLFGGFYFVNFSDAPLLNMFLKSAIITVIYVFLVYKFRISEELGDLAKRFL